MTDAVMHLEVGLGWQCHRGGCDGQNWGIDGVRAVYLTWRLQKPMGGWGTSWLVGGAARFTLLISRNIWCEGGGAVGGLRVTLG